MKEHVPLEVVDNNGDEEVDEDEVLQDDEYDQVDEDVPVIRVFLAYLAREENN